MTKIRTVRESDRTVQKADEMIDSLWEQNNGEVELMTPEALKKDLTAIDMNFADIRAMGDELAQIAADAEALDKLKRTLNRSVERAEHSFTVSARAASHAQQLRSKEAPPDAGVPGSRKFFGAKVGRKKTSQSGSALPLTTKPLRDR
jgi:hypothetical protein